MSSSAPKLKELVEELYVVAVKWKALGVQLEVPQSTLKTIDYENRGKCNEALSDMLDEWLKIQLDESIGLWDTIVAALKTRSVGEVSLARDIESRHCQGRSHGGGRGGGGGGGGRGGGRKPTKDVSLVFLQSLPSRRGEICIIERCACNYSNLGIFLLNDDDGSRIRRIELANHYQPEAIITEVFTEWIASGDHTWSLLIENLRLCSLNTLASDIEEALRHNHVTF